MAIEPRHDSDDRGTELLRIRTALIEQYNSSGDLARALLTGAPTVLDLVPARAAALYIDGVTSTVGDAPEVSRIEQVVEGLRTERRRLPIASESLMTDHPRLAELLPSIAGLLIVPIDGARGLLAWFRAAVDDSESRRDRFGSVGGGEPPPEASASALRSGGSRSAAPWEGLDRVAAQFSRQLDGAILRNLHAHLARFGFHDALTGLSNSQLLMQRIDRALAGPARGAGVVVLCIDLNAFTAVNSTVGHHRGDEVLIQAAERLRSVTRDSDTVARLAGDEFVILAGGADRVVASRIAERVIAALERPFTVAGRPVRLTASIGGTELEAEDTSVTVVQRGRIAMDWAKDFGRTEQAVDDLMQPPSTAAFLAGQRVESLL